MGVVYLNVGGIVSWIDMKLNLVWKSKRPAPTVAWPVVDQAQCAAHLELVGGVEGDLANFGEAVPVAHGVAQRQLREFEQCSLRRVSDHDALRTGSSVRVGARVTRLQT